MAFTNQQQQYEMEDPEMESLKQQYEKIKMQSDMDSYSKGSQSAFGADTENNLAKWQLELNDILERAEHLLRGDKIEIKGGNVIWVACDREEDRTFNEHGVRLIMHFIHMYVNRNTIMSNYDNETINDKVFDFGVQLSDFIFTNCEELGMTSEKKQERYDMICLEITDMVHSAYLRALGGKERESLTKTTSVHQTMNPGMQMPGMMGQPYKQKSALKPWTWF